MLQNINIGDMVKWFNGRQPLGRVMHQFRHRDNWYIVAEDEAHGLRVFRNYERLVVIKENNETKSQTF